MSPKIAISAAAISLLSLSGCCRLFGVCTSVAVHTSITPARSYDYALFDRSINRSDANLLAQSIQNDACID